MLMIVVMLMDVDNVDDDSVGGSVVDDGDGC